MLHLEIDRLGDVNIAVQVEAKEASIERLRQLTVQLVEECERHGQQARGLLERFFWLRHLSAMFFGKAQIVFLTALSFIVPLIVKAQEPCVALAPMAALTIRHATGHPELTLDPELDVWKKAALLSMDKDSSRQIRYPEAKTEIRAFWTDSDIYFLFRCHYIVLNLFVPAKNDAPRVGLWDRDVVEMFLGDDWTNIRHYREFEIAPTGDWIDLAIDLDHTVNERSWRSGWQTMARVDEPRKVWYAAARIPLSSISRMPVQDGTKWRMNLYRIDGLGPDSQRRFICWQPTCVQKSRSKPRARALRHFDFHAQTLGGSSVSPIDTHLPPSLGSGDYSVGRSSFERRDFFPFHPHRRLLRGESFSRCHRHYSRHGARQFKLAVAGAHVAATNIEKNFVREVVSGSDGGYRFLALPPGNYKVVATAPGFDRFVTTGIRLQVNDELRIDVALQVGTVRETVSVEANAVQVEAESTQLGQVVNTKQILSLPLNGRSFVDLLGLQAGVAPVTSESIQQDRPVSGILSAGNVSVNGQRETANAFLVNGGDVSEGRNNGAGLIPNLDSIQEFRLITNSFDAEYGKFSGSVMNAITKSGTNGFHGDVFEFLRNDKFDARNFFDPSKAELRRNQFGYAFGGPFIKDKLFWFTDYQRTLQVQGAGTGVVSLPTVDQRAGHFDPSAFTDANGNPTVVNGDYWAQVLSQRLGYSVQNGEPYGGCASTADCVFPGGTIPQRAFAKPAVGILPYIPLPNLGVDTYSNSSEKNAVHDDKIGQRVDFINEKTGNWYFYYHFDDSTVDSALPAASVPGFPSTTPTRAQEVVMSNVKTFGGTQVNEFRVSFFRTSTTTDQPTGGFAKLADLSFVTGAGTLGIIPSGPAGFPQTVPPIYFNSFSIGVPTLTTFQPNNTWLFSDGFSKVMGKHSMKFGGESRYLQINERNTCAPNGDFTFDGSETGLDFADFLIGAPVSYNQCSQQFLDSRTRYGGLYIQDAYKIKPNFTLNIRLRWEVSMPWWDTQGKIETIVPGLQSTQFPTAPKGWVVPGDPGIPSTLAPTRYNNFAPHVGIAYSPNFSDGILGKITGGPGKTSIRAAYGIYYTSIEDLNLFYEVGDAPFGLYWVSPQSVMFDQPFQTRSDGSSQGRRSPLPSRLRAVPPTKHSITRSIYLFPLPPGTTSTTVCHTPRTTISPSSVSFQNPQY